MNKDREIDCLETVCDLHELLYKYIFMEKMLDSFQQNAENIRNHETASSKSHMKSPDFPKISINVYSAAFFIFGNIAFFVIFPVSTLKAGLTALIICLVLSLICLLPALIDFAVRFIQYKRNQAKSSSNKIQKSKIKYFSKQADFMSELSKVLVIWQNQVQNMLKGFYINLGSFDEEYRSFSIECNAMDRLLSGISSSLSAALKNSAASNLNIEQIYNDPEKCRASAPELYRRIINIKTNTGYLAQSIKTISADQFELGKNNIMNSLNEKHSKDIEKLRNKIEKYVRY